MPTQRPSSPALVFAIGALALLGVIALFHVVLEAPSSTPCSSSLAPGPFRATLVPAHLAAAAILVGCLSALGANRRALAAVARLRAREPSWSRASSGWSALPPCSRRSCSAYLAIPALLTIVDPATGEVITKGRSTPAGRARVTAAGAAR